MHPLQFSGSVYKEHKTLFFSTSKIITFKILCTFKVDMSMTTGTSRHGLVSRFHSAGFLGALETLSVCLLDIRRAKKVIPAIINGKQVLIDIALHLSISALLPPCPITQIRCLKKCMDKWTSYMSNLKSHSSTLHLLF